MSSLLLGFIRASFLSLFKQYRRLQTFLFPVSSTLGPVFLPVLVLMASSYRTPVRSCFSYSLVFLYKGRENFLLILFFPLSSQIVSTTSIYWLDQCTSPPFCQVGVPHVQHTKALSRWPPRASTADNLIGWLHWWSFCGPLAIRMGRCFHRLL
jgi:hypothetical protein